MAGKSRERGQLKKRGHQKYLIRVYLGRDENGKRKYASKIVNGTKKEADASLTKWLREMDTDTFVKPQDNKTVSQVLDEYLASKTDVTRGTLEGYQQDVKRLKPLIGFLKLSQVTELRLQRLFEGLSDRYSYNTVRKTRTVLHAAFKMAVRRRYCQRNPVSGVSLRRPKKDGDQKMVLTPEETNRVLREAEGHHYEALWHVLLGTGMRPQEACALRWSDIEGDKVTIRRVLRRWQRRNTLMWVGEGKTDQSLGKLVLPTSVKAALEEHRSRQAKWLMRTGKRPEHDWVFLDSRGRVPVYKSVTRAWRRLLKNADVEYVRLYGTRHTHATQLLGAGVHPKVIQGRLRHSSITTTMNIYSHLTEEMDASAASVFDQVREAATQ